MKWNKVNESSDYQCTLVNDNEAGDKLFEIGLWWGSGYTLDMYKAYAFCELEALYNVVAYIEKTHPKWLESSDECANDMLKEYDEESPEFQELFMYVDATAEGADKPHFIWSENLRIKECSEVNESDNSNHEIAIINNERKREMRDLMNHLMTSEDELFTVINTLTRILRHKDSKELANACEFAKTAMDSINETKIILRDIEG